MTTVYPCAKVNLGLYIVERRADGYHNLETVFYPIPLCDELSVEVDEKNANLAEGVDDDGRNTDMDRMELSGIPVAGDVSDNLVMKVVRMLRQEFNIPPLHIKLRKNIPSGAGLGGGSSDAAFMMRLLRDMFALKLSDSDMEERVGKLGADCAFFIKCQPTMAGGIGNIFSPINLSLKGMHLVLVKPDDFVSTKEAYSMVKPARPEYDIRETVEGDIKFWKERLLNDFEHSVLPIHPNIQNIKEKLYSLGARYAVMSGSGSSVFGLFDHNINKVEQHFDGCFCFTGEL